MYFLDRLRKFDSGVLVIQSLSHTEEEMIEITAQKVLFIFLCVVPFVALRVKSLIFIIYRRFEIAFNNIG